MSVLAIVALTAFVLVRLDDHDLSGRDARPFAFAVGPDRSSGTMWRPEGPPRATVVLVHGDGPQDRTSQGGYAPLVNALLDAGIGVASWDEPGWAARPATGWTSPWRIARRRSGPPGARSRRWPRAARSARSDSRRPGGPCRNSNAARRTSSCSWVRPCRGNGRGGTTASGAADWATRPDRPTKDDGPRSSGATADPTRPTISPRSTCPSSPSGARAISTSTRRRTRAITLGWSPTATRPTAWSSVRTPRTGC